ncbi:MAG: T9SS type A sorting domain-containing protein [Ignavibacteria bacterium]|nr:T9SS type A sorting domain-containing protein [Ignavibacteria bacterium]
MIDGREFQWDANRDDIDIPALTNSENLGFSEITFNLGVPKLSTWSGTVSITVLHADGESTEYTYGPWTPNLSKAKGMINSVPNSTKMFISRLRVLNSDIRRKIGWVSLSLRESDARFVAGTGQSWVGTSQSVGQAKIGEYSQGEKDALFKFVNSINPGDSSGYFTTVISSNALVPPQPVVSVYDAGGNLLSTDTSTSYAISTSAEDAQITINPSRLRSLNCTPNPAKENITVRYELKSRTVVHLQLFSYSGEEIKMLESGTQEEGLHMSTFDVSALASGTYIVKLSSAENTISTTITIVR